MTLTTTVLPLPSDPATMPALTIPDTEPGLTLPVDDAPPRGRHRAAPSEARRVATALSAAAAGLLATALLGWVVAGVTGLTDDRSSPAHDGPTPSVRVQQEAAQPTLPRTVDITATSTATSAPALVDAAPTIRVASPGDGRTALPPNPRPPTAAQPSHESAPAAHHPTVQPGDSCGTPGAQGLTRKGDPVVCEGRPDDRRARWRRA